MEFYIKCAILSILKWNFENINAVIVRLYINYPFPPLPSPAVIYYAQSGVQYPSLSLRSSQHFLYAYSIIPDDL